MTAEKRLSYRQRIYQAYVSARDKPLAPETLVGLRPRLPYLNQLVRRHFPKDRNAAILDLGCGHGTLLHVLNNAGYRNARGVDGSAAQVAAARKLGINSVEQGEVMATLRATADASLDVIVTFDVIEHFTKDELPALIDELWRALRPGGRWIIHVPNGESPFGSRMRHWDFTHELAFTRTSLAQLLIASGFATVTCFEDRPVPHGITSLVRAISWTCIRACLLIYIAVETGAFDRAAVFSQNMLAVATRD
jgi:2-polyprenyl-3-methyl-5-hydroxy-6-metoxy-1,4-benzoquinol methylase